MDNIQSKLSNVSLYDVKAYVRKAQNAVLNFSDMEAKVREATNNEPWGTPTSVMQDIADGTQSYQQFHEIMPFVYRRFTEKSATQWRQIYKALNLLDYLVKNGSERVVDYARSHTAVIEMLKHFHYESHTGEDRGAGIRRRAEELLSLLGNVDKIRAERKKARTLNQKTGLGSRSAVSGSGAGPGLGGSSRGGAGRTGFYGDAARAGSSRSGNYDSGMTSGSWGAGPGDGVYGGGGADYDNYHSSTSVNNLSRGDENDEWEEYDADLRRTSEDGANLSKVQSAPVEDDDFADFQSAPTTSASTPAAAKPATTDSILDLFSSPAPTTMNTTTITMTSSTTTAPAATPTTSLPSFTDSPSLLGSTGSNTFTSVSTTSPPAAKPAPKNDVFGSIWETSKSSAALTPKQASTSSFGITPSPAPTKPSAPSSTATDANNNGASASQVDDLLLL